MNEQQEPFGYFKAEPFGWTDCAETDEGAIPLYESPRTWGAAKIESLIKERDELLAALKEITSDYSDRFDLESPSTNLGIKAAIKAANAAIDKAES